MPKPGQTQVWLDGAETDNVQRHIALNRGESVLQGHSCGNVVKIDNPRAVLKVMIGVMQQNQQEASTQAPPLVANLIHLLEKLRDARSQA